MGASMLAFDSSWFGLIVLKYSCHKKICDILQIDMRSRTTLLQDDTQSTARRKAILKDFAVRWYAMYRKQIYGSE